MLYEQCFARLPRVRALDLLEDWRPAYGEWLGAQVSAGFDHTTTARALEAADIALAEADAGENDAAWMLRRAAAGMDDGMGEALNAALDFANAKGAGAPHTHAMTEADWKASPWYRKEIPFRPDMTETRARIMAENFDHRRYRDALIARGAEVYNGVGDMALGFGAMLLGCVPDPVNLLPLGGGMAAASRAATLGGAMRAGAKAGAAEGALFTAVVDAIVLPDLATRGEDVEFADFALDTIAGALLGGVFGAAGGALARHRALRQNGSALPDAPDSLDVIDTPDAPATVRAAETPGAAPFDASPDGFLMERATAPAPFDTSPDSFLARAGQGPETRAGETIYLGEPSRAFDASPDGDFLLRAGEGPHTQPGETIYLGEPLPDLPGPAPLPEGMHWKQRVELAYTPETPTGAEQRRTAFARDQHGQAATAARQARIERARAEAPAHNAALEAALREAAERASARNAENDMLRAGMSARDRDDAARALALSVMDFNNAAPVDVSPVLGEAGVVARSQWTMLLEALESGEDFKDVNFGRLSPETKAAINAIRKEEGVTLLDGDDLIIPGNVVRKFHEKRVLENRMSADQVAEMLLRIFHGGADFVSATRYPHIQALVVLRKDLSDIGFIGRNEKTGETVIKSVYHEKTKTIGSRISSSGKNSGTGGRRTPHTVDDADSASPFAAGRLSTVRSGGEETVLHVNRPVNLSPAREPAAVKSWDTPEAAREAEARGLAQQDEALRQQMAELEARGALDPDEAAHARAESADTAAIGNEVLHCAWTAEG